MEARAEHRNANADAVRGLAALFVVITHVMGPTEPGGFLVRLVFSVQIPLFMLVAGYFSFKGLDATPRAGAVRLAKNARRCLVPFAAWWLLRNVFYIRPGQAVWRDFTGLLHDITLGLWFLLTLYILRSVFILAEVAAGRAARPAGKLLAFSAVVLGFEALFFLQWASGSRFLGPEYSGFYLPFFLMGYAYRFLRGRGHPVLSFPNPWISAVSFLVWIFLLINFDLVHMTGVREILVRAAAGITGSLAVLWLILTLNGRVKAALALAGRYSLEIYATHMLFVGLARPVDSGASALNLLMYRFLLGMILCLTLTAMTIYVVKRFPILDAILYGVTPALPGADRASGETRRSSRDNLSA